MLKKFNTKTLAVILIALASIVVLTKFFDDKQSGRTFKEELVNIDTSFVTTILIYPQSDQHAEMKLMKSGEQWTVSKADIASEADTSYVRNLLSTLAQIKPQRLAATEKAKWKEYNTDDSLGTRVKFLSDNDVLLDIVIGKFSYNQMSRSGISYLRLYDEDEIYAVEGFIPMTVNQPFNEWRNKNLLRGQKEDWTKLSFSYPDSSFSLIKENEKWTWGTPSTGDTSTMPDSNKVARYLNELSFLSSSAFADHYSPSASPVLLLTIEGNNMGSPVTLRAFSADTANQYIIHSSYNPNAYFSAAKGNLTQRIFKNRQFFSSDFSD